MSFRSTGQSLIVRLLALGVVASGISSMARAQWVEFVDETATRLVAPSGLGSADPEEKDYAWGDFDHDGDIDLVVVRKQPFTSAGRRENVLFMNENGVLTDRTGLYASASDVDGDQGFLTPTNDRDVVVTDVNGDTWLDIVTAVTISDGLPKHIGHPRVYVNLGSSGGLWQGFRFEDARIPTMLSYTGQSGFNPRFCSIAAGDVTGDGLPDLWLGDYDSSGAGGNQEPPGSDYNDRLLINVGNGFFADQTTLRITGLITIPNSSSTPFEVSAFGAAANLADMNGDGKRDIIKQTSLQAPTYVGISYNSVSPGSFQNHEVVYQQSPYFVSVGDLNNDSRRDMVITDDGQDRYLLNLGNGPDARADFQSFAFQYDAASDDGFGSSSVITDLNNDGWNDVLISDVDVDIGGCTRRLHIYRNLGGTPGSNVILREETSGTNCQTSAGNPASCLVAGIPANMLEGVYDVAVFDINGDGWKDMVLGRCSGTQVYMNAPPIGLAFSFPEGLPALIPPDAPYTFQVQVTGFGGILHTLNTAKMSVSIDGGEFFPVSLLHSGDGLYEATLPALACAETARFFFSAEATNGSSFSDPINAPTEFYVATAAIGTATLVEEGFEGDVSAWQVVNDPSLTGGAWQQAVPVGAITGGGAQSAPDADAEAGSTTKAFVTQNGAPGGSASAADVDGGPTDLISPSINLAGTDGVVTFSRWFFSDGDDSLTVSVSNDGGGSWTTVELTGGAVPGWQVGSFKVGDHVTPTANVRVRFRTSDNPNNDVVEAGLDAFRVEKLVCSVAGGPGRVPDGATVPGVPLTLAKTAGNELALSWGESCQATDTDFEIYEGLVGDFESHEPRLCSTAGASSALVLPGEGDVYYLIVPTDGAGEGSYGVQSDGTQRVPAAAGCRPQTSLGCP